MAVLQLLLDELPLFIKTNIFCAFTRNLILHELFLKLRLQQYVL